MHIDEIDAIPWIFDDSEYTLMSNYLVNELKMNKNKWKPRFL
jgi:hypothetical protein